MSGNNSAYANPQESRGWEIVKTLNEGVPAMDSVSARRLLAEYLKLSVRKPSKLHSAMLSCATKMAIAYGDFHFVPFLEMWGVENLRPEDSENMVDSSGKRFPSLAERLVKAYIYSLMFHPQEHLQVEMESIMLPTIRLKGYVTKGEDLPVAVVNHAIATKVFTADVRNRKMTFVQMMLPDGEEIVAEVHTLTTYSKLRYADIEGRMYDVILRTSDKGKQRVEAAVLSQMPVNEAFNTAIGYIEHIDDGHRHIHVFDNMSRHFVAPFEKTNITVGQYVEFIPVIPKDSNFKTAIITRVLEDGAALFGYRMATITYVDREKGYAAWELLPDANGIVIPIVEANAKETIEPATKGYISQRTLQGKALPEKGTHVKLITFLKRGKDKRKIPYVVDFEVS